ncbi:MAG: hypothetical protein HC802_13110 [Caldilineaceae bacterium]|nr:hypothetical protein [Caldilineaceae bacterium]
MALTDNQREVLSGLAEDAKLAVKANIVLGQASPDIDAETIAALKKRWRGHADELDAADGDEDKLEELIRSILLGDEDDFCLSAEDEVCEDDEDVPIDKYRLARRVVDMWLRQVQVERERMSLV